MTSLPPGTPLNQAQYLVERVLGEGGFGITYLCQEPSLARQVAVKEYFPVGAERLEGRLRPGRLANQELQSGLRRFEKEARILAALDHPNIVRVVGLFSENDTFYLVTEYVAGQVLQGHHQNWLEPIASALAAVHASGLVHGDIKPENILVQHQGRPVLIDFGCSRPSHIQPTSTIVSHGFSPPEQYTGSALTPAADQYALAATWWALAQGSPPPTALERLNGQSMPALSPALARALHLDPEQRWPDLTSFLAALQNPQSEQPIPALAGWVRSLASAPGWLASGGEDRQLRLWPTDSWQPRLLGQHEGWVIGVLFQGPHLYSLGSDRFVHQWDLQTGLAHSCKLPSAPQAAVATQDQLLVGDDKGRIHRLELPSLKLLDAWQAAPSAITAMALPDPHTLACTGDGDRIAVWELSSQQRLERLKGHQATVKSLCAYGDVLYSGALDRRILRWDWREGKSSLVGTTHGTPWCLVADGRGLVSGSGDKRVQFWGQPPSLLGQHEGEVRCLALGPHWVAASGQDGQIRLHPLAP